MCSSACCVNVSVERMRHSCGGEDGLSGKPLTSASRGLCVQRVARRTAAAHEGAVGSAIRTGLGDAVGTLAFIDWCSVGRS